MLYQAVLQLKRDKQASIAGLVSRSELLVVAKKKKKSLRLNHAPGMMAEYSNTHNFFHTVTHNRKFVNFSITPHTCTKIDILYRYFFFSSW